MTRTLFKLNFARIGLPHNKIFIGLWLVGVLQATAIASRPVASGIWLSDESQYQLNETHEVQLVDSLKRITGFEFLRFTEKGFLNPGDPAGEHSGSKQARQILQWAIESRHLFIIEDHSGSPTVHFGQLDSGLVLEDGRSSLRMTIWRVRLDFKDFRDMDAPPEVRRTFDAGFTLLHELLHGLGYKDTALKEEIGECERFVNQVRSELGLPLRDEYLGESIQSVQNITIVRLRFRGKRNMPPTPAHKPARDQMYYLFFLLPINFEFIRDSHDDLHTAALMRLKEGR